MVTTDISQLTAECNLWRQKMRNYRDEFTQLKNQLRQVALQVNLTQKELLREIEHYENQFHIQLINIHDLKHSIKTHEYKASLERSAGKGTASDITWSRHERLFDDYQRLDSTLQDLRDEFTRFISRINMVSQN